MNDLTNRALILTNRVRSFFPDLNFTANEFVRPSKEKLRDFLLASFLELKVNTEEISHVFGQDTRCSVIPAINILATMRHLYLIDESQVGLLDLLNPSVDIMMFIVNHVMDFLECADVFYERVYAKAEKYITAKNTVIQVSEQIDSVLQSINETKMQIQEIQQSITSTKKDYEDASKQHGEVTKKLQDEEMNFRKSDMQLEEVNLKKNEVLRQMNKLKVQIDTLQSRDHLLNDSMEDDYESLKEKLDAITAKREELSQLISTKKEAENNLTRQLKLCSDNLKLCDQMKNISNKLATQTEEKQSQSSSNALKKDISEVVAQIDQVNKLINAKGEAIKVHEAKKTQILSDISESKSLINTYVDRVNNLNRELNKLNITAKEKSDIIVKLRKELREENIKHLQTKEELKMKYCQIFVDLKNQLKQVRVDLNSM